MSIRIVETPIEDVQVNDVIKPYGTVRAIHETPTSRVLVFDEPVGNVAVPHDMDFTAGVVVRA